MPIPTVHAAPGPVRRRLFTVDEFWKMYELGWFASQRVELLGGEIIEMAPQTNWHAVGVDKTVEALKAVFDPAQYWVRNQASLGLRPRSIPDPDVSVVLGSRQVWTPQRPNPTTAELVVEVSETTLWTDRNRKTSLSAAAGIDDYWIVNIPDGTLEVRRDPQPAPSEEFGHGYATLRTYRAGDSVAPLAAPNSPVRVEDLLP